MPILSFPSTIVLIQLSDPAAAFKKKKKEKADCSCLVSFGSQLIVSKLQHQMIISKLGCQGMSLKLTYIIVSINSGGTDST